MMIKAIHTKEFHWNGHDGSVRDFGKYKLLFEKPVFSFEYSSILYTDNPNEERVFVGVDGSILEHTAGMIDEVEAYIEKHATVDPWVNKTDAEDPRLLIEQVTSLSFIETPTPAGDWVPILDWLLDTGETDREKIARAFKQSRVIKSKSDSYSLHTDETLTNNLNGFIPVLPVNETEILTQWRFRVHKLDNRHVEFKVVSSAGSVSGESSYGVSSSYYKGFHFTGDYLSSGSVSVSDSTRSHVVSHVTSSKSYKLNYDSISGGDQFVMEYQWGNETLTLPEKILSGNDALLKQTQPQIKNGYDITSSGYPTKYHAELFNDGIRYKMNGVKYAEFKTNRTIFQKPIYVGDKPVLLAGTTEAFDPHSHIDKIVTKQGFTEDYVIFTSYSNDWTIYEGSGSSSYSVKLLHGTSQSDHTSKDSYAVISNEVTSNIRPIRVELTDSSGNVYKSILIPAGGTGHFIKIDGEFVVSLTENSLLNTEQYANRELEAAIFMGEQELFVEDFEIGVR